MAWTNPKTWNVLEILTSGNLNTQLRDNLIHLRKRLAPLLDTFDSSNDNADAAALLKGLGVSADGVGTPDSDVGGAEDLGAGSVWSTYDLDEDIERDRYYEFRCRVGSTTRFMSSSRFLGGDFLDLDVQLGGSFTQGSEDNVIGLSLPRPNIDGVRTLYIARPATARQILMRVNDDYNVVKLVRLGGLKGAKGDKGDPGTSGADATARAAAAKAQATAEARMMTDLSNLVSNLSSSAKRTIIDKLFESLSITDAKIAGVSWSKITGAPNVLNRRGAFAVNTAYAVGDLVTHSGGLFYCKVAVASSNTVVPVAGSANWEQLDVGGVMLNKRAAYTRAGMTMRANVWTDSGLSVSIEVGANSDVLLEAEFFMTTNSFSMRFIRDDDENAVVDLGSVTPPNSATKVGVAGMDASPGAGVHTYKLQGFAIRGGSGYLANPRVMLVTEVSG